VYVFKRHIRVKVPREARVSENQESSGASRRDVLKSGAWGVGALAGVVGVAGLTSSDASAAQLAAAALPTGTDSYFLKLDGILGDSTDAKHKGEIQLLSFSWGSSNSGATGSASGGAGAGKVSITDFHFAAATSQASPLLFLATATGKHLKTGLLSVRRKGRGQQEYLKIELTDVLVSSYQQGGSNGTVPVDSASLNFSKIKYSFYPQKADGSLGAPVTATWDLKANKGA
jgi:type VI secretion system secreted protein Hcp